MAFISPLPLSAKSANLLVSSSSSSVFYRSVHVSTAGHRHTVIRSPVTTKANRYASPISVTAVTSTATNERGDWEGVIDIVRSTCPELPDAKADSVVSRAFGWGTQKFWRGRMKRQPASTETVTSSLSFLRDVIGLSDNHIAAIVPKFPEVLALSIARMQENVDYISRTYPNLKGQLLINAVLDNPAVLGYDFDCEGDCKSECARCWVQF